MQLYADSIAAAMQGRRLARAAAWVTIASSLDLSALSLPRHLVLCLSSNECVHAGARA